jgi:hypothetical protein
MREYIFTVKAGEENGELGILLNSDFTTQFCNLLKRKGVSYEGPYHKDLRAVIIDHEGRKEIATIPLLDGIIVKGGTMAQCEEWKNEFFDSLN